MNREVKLDTNWTNEQRGMALLALLKSYVCTVTFNKVDGTQRVMPCTLISKFIPPQPEPVAESTRTKNDKVISVWCTDKSAWRSFRIDSVVKIEVQEDPTQ